MLSVEDWFKTFLRKWGDVSPEDLKNYLQSLNLSKVQYEILFYRYVKGKNFKLIPPLINTTDRYMYDQHKKGIKKALDRIDTAVFQR